MRDSQPAASVRAWSGSVPKDVRDGAMWRMEAYRLGLYVCDTAWNDVAALGEDVRTRSLADQLNRSLGSISANIAEGYSRDGGRDRARFLEYALGPAREARDWSLEGRRVVGAERAESQIRVLTSIVRLLTVTSRNERDVHLREPSVPYTLDSDDDAHD